jgi:putative oligomerization/nucleic acid binding protein
VSLRRLRYQLRCAASGHDTRPRLVGGSTVEHRCLRCGAVVGDQEPAASSVHGPAPPAEDGPVLAGLPPARPESAEEPAPAENGNTDAEDEGLTALHALKELGELHAAGVVTDAEFEVKKAELLRRV